MFDKLKIVYLEGLAIIAVTMLAFLFVLRITKLKDAYRYRFSNRPHSVTLKKLATRKIRIQKFYLTNIVVGCLLVVILVILNIKLYNEYDLIQNQYFWLIIILGSLVFIIFINRRIKKDYTRMIREAKDLLQELV